MPSESEPLLGAEHSRNGRSQTSRWRATLSDSVDPASCGVALTLQCCIAGAADAAGYSQTGTWVGFMTGNLTQLMIALMNIALIRPVPSDSVNRIGLSSVSVMGFVFGSLLGAILDARYHGKHRGKLVFGAIGRAVVLALLTPWLVMYGWQGHSGRMILFFMAANMGHMAVAATKLGTTPYSTTVVFTATLANLFSDAMLPFGLSKASQTRAWSLLALLAGGAVTQGIILVSTRVFVQGKQPLDPTISLLAKPHPVGSAFALGLVAIFELFCAVAWLRTKKLRE